MLVVVIVSGDAMDTVYACDAVVPTLSLTCAVKLNVPVAVGVPEIVPLEARVKPEGNDPAVTLQVNPPAPPVAARDCEYVVPTTPLGTDTVVMVIGCALTARVNVADADWLCARAFCVNAGNVRSRKAKNNTARFMNPDYSFVMRDISPVI